MDDPRFVPSEDRTDILVEEKVEVNVLARYFPYANYQVRPSVHSSALGLPRPSFIYG